MKKLLAILMAVAMLSTMVFVAGLEEGAKLLKEYNVGGIIVTDDTVYFSKNIGGLETAPFFMVIMYFLC